MASQEQNPGDATRPLTDSTSQVLKAACGHGETEAQRARCGRAGVVMQVDTLPTQQITSAAWPGSLRIKLYFQLFVKIFKNLSSPTPPPSSSLSFFLLDIKMFSSFLSLFSLFLPLSFLLSSFVYLFFFLIKAIIITLTVVGIGEGQVSHSASADTLVNAIIISILQI